MATGFRASTNNRQELQGLAQTALSGDVKAVDRPIDVAAPVRRGDTTQMTVQSAANARAPGSNPGALIMGALQEQRGGTHDSSGDSSGEDKSAYDSAWEEIMKHHEGTLGGKSDIANAQSAMMQRQMQERGNAMGLSGGASMSVLAQGNLMQQQMMQQATDQWNAERQNLLLGQMGGKQEEGRYRERYEQEEGRYQHGEKQKQLEAYGQMEEKDLGKLAIHDDDALEVYRQRFAPRMTLEELRKKLSLDFNAIDKWTLTALRDEARQRAEEEAEKKAAEARIAQNKRNW